MPYKIKWENNGVRLILSGTCVIGEIFESDTAVMNSGRLADIDFYIWDSTGVENFHLTEADVHSMSAKDAFYNSRIAKDNFKIALVVVNQDLTPFVDEYNSTMKQFRSSWSLSKFSDVIDAESWVGI